MLTALCILFLRNKKILTALAAGWLNDDSGQASQGTVEPSISPYLPGGQDVQLDMLEFCAYLPALQVVHAVAPMAADAEPGKHGVHVVAPVALSVMDPGKQVLQEAAVSPGSGFENLPVSQLAHSLAVTSR